MTNPIKAILVDHLGLENIGTYTHDQIDAFINASAFNGVRYKSAGTQTVAPSSSFDLLTDMSVQEFDVGGGFTPVTGRYQPTVEGYYSVNAFLLGLNITTPGEVFLNVRRNGADAVRTVNESYASNSVEMSVSTVVYLNGSTDYIEFFTFNATSSTMTVDSRSNIAVAKL